jgi:hypothetical protein
MEEFRGDSYCGLYCGACEILNACRRGLETGVKARWEDLPEGFRQHIRQAEIICRGCKTETVFAGCQGCRIRDCAREKKVESCILCRQYPCEHTERLAELVQKNKDFLPHCRVMLKNLDTIKDRGPGQWLKQQEEKWKCPDCGTSFTWYQEKCSRCGRDLESIKDYRKY